MKLFNRGTDPAKAPAPAGPAAANAVPTIPAPAAQPAPVAAPFAAPPAAAPAPEAPAPAEPDLTAILDANVKEMSEKIARLTTSLEDTTSEKAQFEQKIEQMEERMRKLSALTEMISAQYNPFVGDAPTEREPLPTPEVGLAPPAAASPPMAMPMPPAPQSAQPPEDLPPFGEMPSLAPPMEMEHELLEEEPQDYGAHTYHAPAHEPEAPAHDDAQAHLWTVRPSFESSLLMLGWADMLLKNVPSRDSLADLVGYYHNIGWLGDVARDQLMAYADGIVAPPGQEQRADWRTNVEVHEKSLLFLEKLKALNARGRAGR